MPFSLHVPTLFVCTALIHLAGAALLLRIMLRKGEGEVWPWAAYSFCLGIAQLFLTLRGIAPPMLLLVTAPTLLQLGAGLLWLGTHRLRGGRLPAALVLAAPTLWLAVLLLVPDMAARPRSLVASNHAMLLAWTLAGIAEALRAWRAHRMRAALDLAIVLCLVVVWSLLRLGAALLGPIELLPPASALVAAVLAAALPYLGLSAAREAAARRDASREAGALRAARAELDRLHAGLPAIIFLRELRPDGTRRLSYRGGDVRDVLGWPAEAMEGVEDLSPWTDLSASGFDAFWGAVARQGTGSVELLMRQPDGGWRPLRCRCRVLARRADGTVDVVGFVLDISAERAAEARALAAARLASLGEMAAGMAHELRQPLAAIALAADIARLELERGAAPAAAARLEEVAAQAGRAGDLIEHLRRFARGPEGGLPARPVPLEAAVAGAMALAGSALREIAVRPEIDLGSPAPVVLGDLVALEQVLVNLLLNARDALAAKPAGEARRLGVSATREAGSGAVRIAVADNGGGIPPEVMARLFEPFVTTKGPDRGTGLGLSICHGLVGAMGGRIEARNAEEGAVVTIRLCPAPRSGA